MQKLGPPILKRGRTYEMGCCTDKRYDDAAGRARPWNGCTESTCMSLPDEKTCADCVLVEKCVRIFGVNPASTSCEFFPRRFRDKAEAVV